MSSEDTNTPPSSSTKNVWANGSHQPTCLSTLLVDVLAKFLVSVVFSLTSLGSLVETIVSLTVSKVPLAE